MSAPTFLEPAEYVDLLPFYQRRAWKLAEGRAVELDYLIPGLVGKVGELFAHRSRAHRDDDPFREVAPRYVLAYGAAAWMTATALRAYGVVALPRWAKDSARQQLQHRRPDPGADLLADVTAAYTAWSDDVGEELVEELTRTWVTLQASCAPITGRAFPDVLDENLRILELARKERLTA